MKKHFALIALFMATQAAADAPEIKEVQLRNAGGSWRVDVTLAHPDTGWDHYADGWRVELQDGTVLGTRVLAHPHVTEQPFTRSLGGVDIPAGTGTVYVRARCNVDGWNQTTTQVDVSAPKSP